MSHQEEDRAYTKRMVGRLEENLRGIEWETYPPLSSVRSRHDGIQAAIMSIGRSRGYTPVAEFNAPVSGHRWRIDVGWFNDNFVNYAFEIDGGVAEHSVKKLNSLSDNTKKIIVSKTPNKARIEKQVEERLPDDFFHIDAALYDSDWLPGRKVEDHPLQPDTSLEIRDS